jgi:hypothetical protein
MRTLLLGTVAVSVLFLGCVVHHRSHRTGPRPGGPEPTAGEPAPPPDEPSPPPDEPSPPPDEPSPPETRTHRAPPAPEQPALVVRLGRTTARRGEDLKVFVEPFHPEAMVFFNGRPLPKKTRGNHFVITVPGNAESGNVEVQVEGRRYGAPLNVVD